MSLVHRVIILNKPLKIRGLTISQWIMGAGGVGVALLVGTQIPQQWKIGNLPAGFIVGMIIVCAVLFVSQAAQMKPIAWWRNMIAYRLKLVPLVFMPRPETGTIYPDPSVIEASRRDDRPYVS